MQYALQKIFRIMRLITNSSKEDESINVKVNLIFSYLFVSCSRDPKHTKCYLIIKLLVHEYQAKIEWNCLIITILANYKNVKLASLQFNNESASFDL
jgi:hypothetical protein